MYSNVSRSAPRVVTTMTEASTTSNELRVRESKVGPIRKGVNPFGVLGGVLGLVSVALPWYVATISAFFARASFGLTGLDLLARTGRIGEMTAQFPDAATAVLLMTAGVIVTLGFLR